MDIVTVGFIAGIIVGSAVLLFIIVFIGIYCVMRRMDAPYDKKQDASKVQKGIAKRLFVGKCMSVSI